MKKTFFISIIILGLLQSCKVDCDALAESYGQTKCLIIVKEIPLKASRHNFYVKGKSLKTEKDTVYDEENRWFCEFYKYIDKNDTIIKQKGELKFNIHKKDTVISFDFECPIGKKY
jgi:hypothetical protein